MSPAQLFLGPTFRVLTFCVLAFCVQKFCVEAP